MTTEPQICGSKVGKHEFGGMAPTHERPFPRDVVIINIWAIILWPLALEATLECMIIKVLKLRRGQRTLGNRKVKGFSCIRT